MSLVGTGLATPAPAFSPDSVLFDPQEVGTVSVSRQVELKNDGKDVLNIASLMMTGDFTIVGSECGATLGAGSGCKIDVAFAPTAEGARTGRLTLHSDAPGSPHSLALAGTGIVP